MFIDENYPWEVDSWEVLSEFCDLITEYLIKNELTEEYFWENYFNSLSTKDVSTARST